MSFLSDVLDWFIDTIKDLIKTLLDFIRKYWVIILIIVLLYIYAPAIATYLTEIGAPQWLASAVANFPSMLEAAGNALWAFGQEAGAAFLQAGWQTQLAVVAAAGYAINPDGTQELVEETIKDLAESGSDLIGSVVDSLFGGNFLLYAGIGLGAYLLLRSSGSTPVVVAQKAPLPLAEGEK